MELRATSGGYRRVQVCRRESVERHGTSALQNWREPAPLALEAAEDSSESSDDEEDGCNGCTYDYDGEGKVEQLWYRCLDCWGGDEVDGYDSSSLGCCKACARTCHRGHRLQKCGRGEAACDCGQNNHQPAVCTAHVTRQKATPQPFYTCRDCFSEESAEDELDGCDGICYQCMLHCHPSHEVDYLGIQSGYCRCGTTSCSTECSILAPAPRRLS